MALANKLFLSLVFLIILSPIVNADSYTQALTKEKQQSIDAFWQTGEFSTFQGKANISIAYAQFFSEDHQDTIVFSPGRTEGYLKYDELVFDLYQQGYNVFVIDHRGQGISQRLLNNPHKGYVKYFDDYSEDLNQFIDEIVVKTSNHIPHILSHSMGGTIAVRYLQLYPSKVKSVVLSSPMIAINAGAMPNWFAHSMVATYATFNDWFSDEPWYFIGQNDYKLKPFDGNDLSQDAERYKAMQQKYLANPTMQLGGVTAYWLQQAIQANEDIFAHLNDIDVPVLLLQSGADVIVDNEAQDEFCQQLHALHTQSCPDGKAIVFEGARHEIFIEKNEIRAKAFEKTIAWYKQHSN
ncbi:alpha/beta fold hydrolase [Thalassotalea agarivorans]|uniref:Lysophospholipase n=1 Tax=Thalassotalea agarivorans TaxID=349064 RepID=A0A1I0HPX6_THASX|nr:alpha/beta fold hydrolase [Thalassotalea agarivorans]SET86050.1 lysophospholipase [Thalassotalea agarivorans]